MVTLYANVYVKHSFFQFFVIKLRLGTLVFKAFTVTTSVSLQTTFLCILVAYLYRKRSCSAADTVAQWRSHGGIEGNAPPHLPSKIGF